MKTLIYTFLIAFVFSLFSPCYAFEKNKSFQNFRTTGKVLKLMDISSNTQKTLKLKLTENPEGCLTLMESALFITGVVFYFTGNASGDPMLYDDYSYRSTGLILMGISVGGGIISLLGSSDYSNSHYGPRSCLHKNQNIQLSLNGQGLGLRMTF